jgi:hypothetical protein
MHDAARMRAAQRVQHLPHEMNGLAQLELPGCADQVLQGRPGHELEHSVERSVLGFSGIEQAHDVGVRQLDAQTHFPAEALEVAGALGPGGPFEPEDLDRHLLARGQLPRLVHATERPGAELGEDLVSPLEYRAGVETLIDRRRHLPTSHVRVVGRFYSKACCGDKPELRLICRENLHRRGPEGRR